MLKYINIAPQRILGMIVFVAIMIGFIIWVTGFRKKVREIIKNRKYFFILSGVLLLVCIGSLIFKGLNFGLDFTGGTVIQVAVDPDVKIPRIKQAIAEYAKTTDNPSQYENPKVQLALEVEEKTEIVKQEETPTPTIPSPTIRETREFPPKAEGDELPVGPEEIPTSPGVTASPISGETSPKPVTESPEVVETKSEKATPPVPATTETDTRKFRTCFIHVQEIPAAQVDGLIKHLKKSLGYVDLLRVETIGPTIGEELKNKALIALAIALFAQLIYITFRFGTQLRYGIAADIALLHDLVIMIGLYSLLGKPVNSPFLAALLTIIGYSVMDTVVVFDRVRENLKLMRGGNYSETVNLSLNQVITRTAATSFTTIIVLFAIYYFGGDTLNDFAVALLIGAVAGTYSSLFIASPLIVLFDKMAKEREQKKVEQRRAKLRQEAEKKAIKKEEKKEGGEEEKPKKKKLSRKRRR